MTRGHNKEEFSSGDAENSNRRLNQNQDLTIDPALLDIQNDAAIGSQHPSYADQATSDRLGQREPRDFPRSWEQAREVRPQMSFGHGPTPYSPRLPSYGYSQYPDTGLRDRSGLGDSSLYASVIPGSSAAPGNLQGTGTPAQETDVKRVTRSSKKRTSAEAGLSANAEDYHEDATSESRRSTRRSKRTKVTSKHNDAGDEGEEKIRKISKLNAKIAEGKGPKKGAHGPNGEVRLREDGRMEFRDVNFPEWTLAAYHNDYRRQFIDDAAELGEFDHTPARGDAAEDETSYEPQQQSWGPTRADWQHIMDAQGKRVMFEVEKPKSRRPPQEPSNWTHDGLILLDSKNHPVKDWPGLNKTLSSEIENWRWEALMRVYPWLTVADLMARMPHTREKKGQVLPLQTPQAFTNRAHRFRVPNQIPASNPKNGSETYKKGILKNLAKKQITTTEGLSALDPEQVENVRKANKGKFRENSRYVVKKDEDPAETPAPSKKRKVHCDDDAESTLEQVEPKAKRPRTQMGQNIEVEAPNFTPGFIYDNAGQDANLGSAGYYSEPTATPGIWGYQEQGPSPTDTASLRGYQSQENLVLLFATIDDLGLALVEDPSFTSPDAVIWARRNGNQQTRQIEVHWYRESTPRYVGPDGVMREDVVAHGLWNQAEAFEPIPGDDQTAPEVYSAHNIESPFSPNSFPPEFDPFFRTRNYEGYQGFVGQIPNYPETPTVPSLQTPLSAPSQIGRYQTQADSSEEVWRNHHGSTGF